jgi:hypothetical protein
MFEQMGDVDTVMFGMTSAKQRSDSSPLSFDTGERVRLSLPTQCGRVNIVKRVHLPVFITTFLSVVAINGHRLAAMSPYEVDAHTLHLWHLDENGPPFADSGISPKPLLGLLNGAKAGYESMPGMGRAVSFNHSAGGRRNSNYFKGALLMAQPKSVDGPEDNVTAPFPVMGEDGAFTMEALIKFERLPTDSPGVSPTIISMDSEDENRVFNFRIEKPGFLSFRNFRAPRRAVADWRPFQSMDPMPSIRLIGSMWRSPMMAARARQET